MAGDMLCRGLLYRLVNVSSPRPHNSASMSVTWWGAGCRPDQRVQKSDLRGRHGLNKSNILTKPQHAQMLLMDSKVSDTSIRQVC